MLAQNLQEVETKIQEACKKSNRSIDEVTLIAVSKTKPVSMLKEIYNEGVYDFGENKVQEIMDKYDRVDPVRWHLIGHLQTNKVKYIIDKVSMIHSVESLKLAQEINKRAQQHDLTMDILIQVNSAMEESKFGITTEETGKMIEEILETFYHLLFHLILYHKY